MRYVLRSTQLCAQAWPGRIKEAADDLAKEREEIACARAPRKQCGSENDVQGLSGLRGGSMSLRG